MERQQPNDGGEQQHWTADTEPAAHEPARPAAEDPITGPETIRPTPRIFLSDDAAFAKDVSRGRWLDASDDPESLTTTAQELVATSPFPSATASIRHQDGFEGLVIRPDADLATVSRLARGVAAHGRAFVAYVEAWGSDEEAVEQFAARFQSSWPDVARWAEAVAEERGWWDQLNDVVDADVLPFLRIDFVKLGRELTYDYYVVEDDERGQVHVFRLHD